MSLRKKIKSAKKNNYKKRVSNNMLKNVRKKNKNHKTDIELEVDNILKELNVEYSFQKAISRCHVDFFIPPKLVIEVNGCYWHGHTACQKEISKKQLRWRAKDANRYKFLRNAGYELILIWGCQLKKKKKDYIKKITEYINEHPK